MKRFIVFMLMYLIPSFLSVFSQNKIHDFDFRPWYLAAEELYNSDSPTAESDEEAMILYKKTAAQLFVTKQYAQIHIDCLKKIADIYLGRSDYKEAITFYRKVIEMNRHTGLNDSIYDYQAKLYLGSTYYQSNIIDSARYYLEQAAIYTRQRTDLADLSFLYNSLGIIYYESANYLQAKNYFEQAFPDDDSLQYKDADTYVSLSTNIATCLKFLGKEQEALAIYHRLLPLKIATEKICYNIASTHLLLHQYDSALLYYEKITVTGDVTAVKKMNDIGRILTEKGKWSQAEKILDSAILLNKQNMASTKNKELAYSYLYRALLAEKQGLTDEAIVWCNNALQILHFDFKWKQPTDLPENETKVISPLVFFEVLKKKAELLAEKYQMGKDKFLGESSLTTYMKAIRVASFINASFDNDDARLFFKDNHRDIYSDAIQIAYELIENNSKDAKDNFLRIMESYKGSILYQNLADVELKRSDAIEPSVIRKEKELKQLLAAYTTRLNNNAVAEDIPALQERIIELEVEISRLQKIYEAYPGYKVYKRQSDANYTTVDAIHKQLDDQTAVISFLYTQDYIYGLAITDKNFVARRITLDSSFNQSIETFLTSFYEHTGGKRFDGYDASAFLYQRIIKPFYIVAGDKKRWVVLPDGILNYMPFNVLQENSNERHYLAEDKIISNHYSLMLLLSDSRNLKGDVKKPVIFAPFVDESTHEALPYLPSLFSSLAEVAAIKGRSFTADKATKTAFLNTATQASIIHLATHATSDPDSGNNACIYFYPSDTNYLNTRLYAPEVYNLELHNTRLVILSACETAGGKNSSGEGLLSLARAFLYAGSDGVISTLWKTEDRVSGYIMQRLHYHLQKGKSPEEALYLAKKDFLKSNEFDSHYKTPNYWGNFIYIGNLTQISQSNDNLYYLGAAILLSLILLYVFITEKRKIAQ
jgi:CHAT domain-containing protein/Tfp pilus assembly protein PilF